MILSIQPGVYKEEEGGGGSSVHTTLRAHGCSDVIDLTVHMSPQDRERERDADGWMERKRVAAEEALTDRDAGSRWMNG